MEITEEYIAAAANLNACQAALDWLREKPRTLKELAAYNQDWAVWVIRFAPDIYAERAWSALMSLPGGPSEYSLRGIVEWAPDAWRERAWAALLALPGGPREGSLRYIALFAPAPFADKARAEMARRETAK